MSCRPTLCENELKRGARSLMHFSTWFHPSHSASPHDCSIQTGLPITTVLSWRAGLERFARFLKLQFVLDPHRPFNPSGPDGRRSSVLSVCGEPVCQGSNLPATVNCISRPELNRTRRTAPSTGPHRPGHHSPDSGVSTANCDFSEPAVICLLQTGMFSSQGR